MKIYFRYTLVMALVFSIQGVYSQIHNDTLLSDGDAAVYSGSIGANYGTATSAIIGASSTTLHYRFFSNYNISSLGIPANAVISSATLLFTPAGIGEGTVTSTSFVLETVSASWNESTVTYSNQPAISSVNQVTTSSLVSGKRTFNITTLVQNIVNGTTTNYGWRIRRNPENVISSLSTYATEEASAANKPVLKITWYIPMTITGATIGHCNSLVSSEGSITPTLIDGSSSFSYLWINSAGTTVGTSLNLTNVGYGWYGLKVTGSLGDIFYMAFIVGSYCQSTTIPFNPGPNYIDDAVISSAFPSNNYGTNVSFIADKAQDRDLVWFSEKSLIKFKLWIDPNSTVSQANLVLTGKAHVFANRSNAAQLDKITQTWQESSVTWNTIPSSSTTPQTIIPLTTSATENKTLNTIAFWNDWKNSNTTNYGMLMQLQSYSTPAAAMSFHSSDATTSSNRPTINFIFVVNALAGTITPGASAICSGSTTLLTLSGYSIGATFQWQKCTDNVNFVNIGGATASTYTTLGSTVVNTYYRCVVTVYSCSAVNSASQLITIKPVPTITVNDATFCSGNNVTLTATPSIGGGTYAWSTGGTTASIQVAPLVNTNYTIIYTLNGCPSPIKTSAVTVCQQYVKLERMLTGINYNVFAGNINFFFEQEYTSASTTLTYQVFSSNNRSTPVMTGITNSKVLTFADNRYKLDVSSLSAGTYILEVKNDKNELFYLRFIK